MSVYDYIWYIVMYAVAFLSILCQEHFSISWKNILKCNFLLLGFIYFNYIIYVTILLAHGLGVYILYMIKHTT